MKISVITPVFNPVWSELRECLKSARGPNIEHILVLDGKSSVKNLKRLRGLAKKYKARLEISREQGGISKSSNRGAGISTGDILVFLDQDDFFVKGWWKPLLELGEEFDFAYSDCFHADEDGKAIRLIRKPDWSPVRLIFNMYAVHFMAVRKSIFDKVGGFQSKFDGSQDHDLALRVSKVTKRIVHISTPLYYWRASRASTVTNPENKLWAFDAGLEAAREHLEGLSIQAELEKVESFPGALKANFPERDLPVSIVIPTAFKKNNSPSPLISQLLTSLKPFMRRELGDEIVIVYGKKDDPKQILDQINSMGIEIKLVKDLARFNFSQRSNIGFLSSKNEHILLLNDDVSFDAANPLNQLFGLLSLPNVGLVGALLVYPNYSIQHGGHAFIGGNVTHAHHGVHSLAYGLMDLVVDHEVVGVTGAFMFQTKSTWKAVGGFSAMFPLNYNDVDYCLKIRTLNFDIIQANSVVAFHHESATRLPVVEKWEQNLLNQRWSDSLYRDPFATS